MNEISEILGIQPGQIDRHEDGVDETDLQLGQESLNLMLQISQGAMTSLDQLKTKNSGFVSEIRQLSQEMNDLEVRSSSLHHRVRTREQALEQLEPLLVQYSIPSHIVTTIYEGEMDANWCSALDQVRKPIDLSKADSKCAQGAAKLRKTLVLRAVERAKAFYITRLRMLRRPGANAQKIQIEMIQGAAIMELLRMETPRLASSLALAYRNTIQWYYTMLFGKYGRWLGRQPLMAMDTPKLLGQSISHSGRGSLLSMGKSIKSIDSFSVGARPSVLHSSAESLPCLPMTAVPSTSTPSYPLEILVRSALIALSDSFELESKVSAILMPGTKPSDNTAQHSPSTSISTQDSPSKAERRSSLDCRASEDPADVFGPTLEFYGGLIKNWINQCTGDLFGLLIVARLASKSPLKSWVESWLEPIVKLCWSHILSICAQQAASIEHSALKASTLAGGSNISGPHALTQLVSSYLSGILQLCPGRPEPELSKALSGIIEAYELFISKLANGDEKVLFNNYFVMSALLSDLQGPLASEFARHFQLLVEAFSANAS